MSVAIETHALVRHYGSRRGIDSINLAVPEGALFGFLGPNGAGKTTAIRVLLGLLRPQSGKATVLGLDAWSETKMIKAEVGYVPGDLRLYGWMNGESALSLVQRVRKRSLVKHGRELADRFNLDLSVKVRKMSRGTRQKLGLILALAHKPRLLILDEPTATLDPLMQDTLHEYLRELAALGHTVFFSSHTLSEVESLCQRVAIIREGKIVADETLESLVRHAGQQVRFRWKPNVVQETSQPPAGLIIESRKNNVWRGTYRGPIDELVRWLATLPLDDVEIRRASLESLFRQYYDRGDEA